MLPARDGRGTLVAHGMEAAEPPPQRHVVLSRQMHATMSWPQVFPVSEQKNLRDLLYRC
jgi:hypothetical protein